MKKDQEKGPCPVCGRWKNRAMSVDAVVVSNGRLLLIRRNNEPFKDFWALPGGYMDFDETALEAAMRELKEETGLDGEASRFIGLYSDPSRHPEQVVSAAFLVTDFKGTLAAGDDAGEAEWFPADNLPQDLAFDHGNIIRDALKAP